MGSSPPSQPIRLAILEADTPVAGVQAEFGGYGGVFTHLFRRAVAPAPLEEYLALSAHDVVGGGAAAYPDPETLDAVLISGSKHSAFEHDEWIERLVAYTKRLLEGGRVRVIGVCFGHQIVGRALGAPVGRSPRGWELAVVDMALTDEGKRLFPGLDSLRIHQMHRDEVHEYPAGAVPLAHTPVCATQAMYIPRRMIAVQGHPEFTESMVREILQLRHDGGIISDGIFEDAMSRVADKHDGVAIAQAFLRFLRE